MLSIVAAVAENNIIGKDNTLIWSIPSDLARFKSITLSGSKSMVMGRKTFESIGKILPGRKHIVISRNTNYNINNASVQTVHNIYEIKPFIDSSEEYFVIGGGEIYSLLLPYVKRMYITIVHESFKGDVYFPYFDKSQWRVLCCEENPKNELDTHNTSFMILEKI